MTVLILKTKEDLKEGWIEPVLPKSQAEKAGLLPGGQFITVEGIEMKEVKEIPHALD